MHSSSHLFAVHHMRGQNLYGVETAVGAQWLFHFLVPLVHHRSPTTEILTSDFWVTDNANPTKVLFTIYIIVAPRNLKRKGIV